MAQSELDAVVTGVFNLFPGGALAAVVTGSLDLFSGSSEGVMPPCSSSGSVYAVLLPVVVSSRGLMLCFVVDS